jgi:hypothetical protein
MQMRFTGEYTNDRTSITYLGCTFEGHDWTDVGEDVAGLLKSHPEFEVKRGRPKKVVSDGASMGE